MSGAPIWAVPGLFLVHLVHLKNYHSRCVSFSPGHSLRTEQAFGREHETSPGHDLFRDATPTEAAVDGDVSTGRHSQPKHRRQPYMEGKTSTKHSYSQLFTVESRHKIELVITLMRP